MADLTLGMQRNGQQRSPGEVIRDVVEGVVRANAAVWNDVRPKFALATVNRASWEAMLRRPFARVAEHSCCKARRKDPVLRAAVLYELILVYCDYPDKYSPCEACAWPTTSWCEGCDNQNRAMCTLCQTEKPRIDCEGCPGCRCCPGVVNYGKVVYARTKPGAEVPSSQKGTNQWAFVGALPDYEENGSFEDS